MPSAPRAAIPSTVSAIVPESASARWAGKVRAAIAACQCPDAYTAPATPASSAIAYQDGTDSSATDVRPSQPLTVAFSARISVLAGFVTIGFPFQQHITVVEKPSLRRVTVAVKLSR